MLKNLKKVAAIVLSFAMAVQFGLADSYYVNAVEEPVEPQQQEETTTTTPQEQEEAPTTEEEAPQQQEEEDAQPAADEEPQPAAEEAQPQPQPVEKAEVKVSYVKEDGTDLMESVTATYDVGYRLDQDTNVFKEAHEAFEFEYAFVNGNKENKITKDQVKASGLTVTSDMTSLTLVYKSTATQKDSKDKKVETANLSGEKEDDSDSGSEDKNISVASNTDTTRTIRVGEKIKLDSSDVDTYNYYDHNWTVADGSKVRLNKTNGLSITVTGLQEGTTTVTDTYSSTWGWGQTATKEYTITVNAAVVPTSISISGADTVTQFKTTQLTANLTPEGANGKVTWTSSNEQILSVDENGLVTGNRQGSATITASVQGADKNTLSATKTIEVVKNESPSSGNKREALVYYLKDPTKDANSNGSDQWGPSSLGTAVVNVEGATWTGNKNCFDNVDQRVLSWPTDLNGTNVVPRSNNAWDLIFDAYKASIESELGLTITKDDVEEITLDPAKISRNNGTNPDMHLDCNVKIKCKSVALVKYYLFDANGTNWEMLGSKNYLVKDESTTQPSDVTSKELPTTKTVNGVTYTFSGWYTDKSLTTPAPSFPAKVTGSVTYYAKYVAGYQVTYNLAGGKFSNGSTSATEKHNVDTNVVVKEAPTRKGYKFTGWTVEGLDGTTTINSGDTFTMPNGNVTLTANWQEQKIADFITLTPTDVIKPYDGKTYTAGTATVSGKTASPIPTDLKIEYSIDGKTWTTDPSTITATNVSDSKIVKVRVSSDNYTGELKGEENLEITKRPVTVTGRTYTKVYGTADPELEADVDNLVKGDNIDYAVTRAPGNDVGDYAVIPSGEKDQGNYEVTYKNGKLTITKAEKFELHAALSAESRKKTYDGNKLEGAATATVTEGTTISYSVDGGEWTTKVPSIKNVKKVTVKAKAENPNYETPDEIEYTLEITKRPVTVTGRTYTKVYGTADPELEADVDNLVKGDNIDYAVTRAPGNDVGDYAVIPSGEKDQGNYEVTYKNGKLTITKAETMTLTPELTGKDAEKTYDSKPLSGGAKASVKEGTKITYSTDGGETWSETLPSITDVGTLNVKAKAENKNYKDVTVDYTLKVTRKAVTVTADNKSKLFGETDPKLTAKVAGTLGNDTVDYTLSRETGEDVGKYTITASGKTEQGNYSVTYVAGTLTITSQSIDPGKDPEKPNPDYTGAKVNSPSDEVYDGKKHKWSPTVTDKADKKLKAGTDYTVEYSTSDFTNVGTIEVVITGKGNYNGTVKRSYKVTPKEYTVTTESATKTYSGTALTAGGKVEGIVSGETVEFTTTGSQIEVGTSKNTYELVWKSAKATNYTLAKESIGELTVKAKSIVPDDSDKTGITVSEPSDSKYDGKEHKEVLTVTDTKTGKELVAGTDYSVTYSSDLVNAGTVTIKVAGLGNYTGSFTKTYKITKRSVTLTSATVNKVYDGSALTNTSITVSGDGFVEGEGASYEVTGTQTEVGNSANAFEYKLNENTLASNYNITKVVGTLTITAAPAPVTPATPSTPSTPSTTPRTPSAPQVTTPAETVEKETTPKAEPKKEEKVEEEYTPKASPQYYWALINLICAILTVLFGLLLLISKRHKSEDEDEEDDDETKQQTNDDDEDKEQEKKRGLFTRVLAVLIAIVSVVFFLVTEDLSLPWTWTDQWTIWMVVIGLVQIVVFFVGRKWKNVDDDEDEEEAQQA